MVGRSNDVVCKAWLEKTPKSILPGLRILDAGAGKLANKKFCDHLNYVSQDFCQYEGTGDNKGLQSQSWDTMQIDIIGGIKMLDRFSKADTNSDEVLCFGYQVIATKK